MYSTVEDICMFKHKTPVQIRFNDIDIMGHVNNAVHQYYFDLARMNYFLEIFTETTSWHDEALVVASIKVDYIVPVFLTDNIHVETSIYEIGNRSIMMRQQVVDNKGDIKSVSDTRMVAFSNKKSESIVLPERWVNKIVNYEYEVSFKYPQ